MRKYIIAITALFSLITQANTLPNGFVYLRDVDPSIIQDMRYAGNHNFVGRPLEGYEAAECILTKEAAINLSKVQKELQKSNLSLKVYDCYRPVRAVKAFVEWAKDINQREMQQEFYPTIPKKDLFPLKYIAENSVHSRGSGVDLTIVRTPVQDQAEYRPGQRLTACTASYLERFADNSIDMGTGYDCFDEKAHADQKNISVVAYQNRGILRNLMEKHGFVAYPEEWWYFTLKDEPSKDKAFDFPIKKRT